MDRHNAARMNALVGELDGMDVLPQLTGEEKEVPRRLYWRLQGQAAVLDGADKLVCPSHRWPQLFRPADDLGESNDLAGDRCGRAEQLLGQLAEWEQLLSTAPA